MPAARLLPGGNWLGWGVEEPSGRAGIGRGWASGASGVNINPPAAGLQPCHPHSTMATANDRAVLQTIFNPSTPFGDIPGLDEEEEDVQEEGEADAAPGSCRLLPMSRGAAPLLPAELPPRGGLGSILHPWGWIWGPGTGTWGWRGGPGAAPSRAPGAHNLGAGACPLWSTGQGLAAFVMTQRRLLRPSCWSRSGTWSCRGFLPLNLET